MRQFPLGALCHEALADLVSLRWRYALLIAILSVMLTGLSFGEMSTAQKIRTTEESELRAGSTTTVIGVVPERAELHAQALGDGCRRLNSEPLFAGAIGRGSQVELSSAPTRRFERVFVTAGLPKALGYQGPDLPWTVVVADTLTEVLGVAAGAELRELSSGRPIEVSQIVGESERDLQASTSLMVLSHTAPWSECWVEFPAWAPHRLISGVAASFDVPATELRARRALPPDDLRVSPAAQFETRPTRILWLPAAVGFSIMWFLMLWFTRPITGLYRTLGASRASLAVYGAQQMVGLVGPAGTLGALASVAIWARADQPAAVLEVGLRPVAYSILALLAAGLVSGLMLALGSAANAVKE